MKPLCLLIAAIVMVSACASNRVGPPACDGARRQPVNAPLPDAIAAFPALALRC